MDYQSLVTLLEKFKIPIALSLVGLVLITGGLLVSPHKQPQQFPKESIVSSSKEINVDVSGAVETPGVYKLLEGSRVEDALKLAGGIKEEANQEYVAKTLNLAQKLTDGSKIYIPYEGESASGGVVAGLSSTTQVNINSASQSELEALPGVGPVTASKIISGRPYQKIEELLDKKVVNKATFEKIKDSVTLY